MIRNLAFLFLIALFAAPCTAAQPYQPASQDPLKEPWRWRHYPQLDGLGLRCLTETSDGAMWFGTDEGVRRYDGLEWTSYTSADGLLGRSVISLAAGPDGQLLAGSESGISAYRNGAWKPVFPPSGDPPWPVNDLLIADSGDVWAGTAWGALGTARRGVDPVHHTRRCGGPPDDHP